MKITTKGRKVDRMDGVDRVEVDPHDLCGDLHSQNSPRSFRSFGFPGSTSSTPSTLSSQSFRSFVVFFLLVLLFSAGQTAAADFSKVKRLLGNQDSAILVSPQGKILFSHHPDVKRVPASTLKVLTSLVGLHHLGPDYRFPTEFYLDSEKNLIIKGYGDPLLISEVIPSIAVLLSEKITQYRDMILDNTYFEPIEIPGVTTTLNPYDAPNGSLCVNFNTVNFIRKGQTCVSAEPQTPMLPYAQEKIDRTRAARGRIIFSQENDEITLYAGHLFTYFLQEAGIRSSGNIIRIGKADPEKDRLILRFNSPFVLTEVIQRLLQYSNNFIANQVLAAAGAKAYGPPANMEKGVRAAMKYAVEELKIKGVELAEGSGISRENRISPKMMIKVLEEFAPYRELMQQNGSKIYKTGSLYGVSSRAGYLRGPDETLYPFVVFINTKGRSAETVMDRMAQALFK